MAVARRDGITLKTTHQFLIVLFGGDVHAKRVYSLANATLPRDNQRENRASIRVRTEPGIG
jgi:hypothetical protein